MDLPTIIHDALPLINLIAVAILGALHVKNAGAIANAGTTLAADSLAVTHGNLVASLPKLIADAQAAGVAIGAAQTSTVGVKPNA